MSPISANISPGGRERGATCLLIQEAGDANPKKIVPSDELPFTIDFGLVDYLVEAVPEGQQEFKAPDTVQGYRTKRGGAMRLFDNCVDRVIENNDEFLGLNSGVVYRATDPQK